MNGNPAQKISSLIAATWCGLLCLPQSSAVGQELIDVPVKVAYAKGNVTDGGGKALKIGDRIKTGDSVRTGMDGTVDLIWNSEGGGKIVGKAITRSVIRLEHSSELKIDKMVQFNHEDGSGMAPYTVAKMDLKEGSIFANIKKSPAGKFEIKTVNSVAGIRGTAFKLSKSGTIIVTEGRVVNKIILPNGRTVEIPLEQGGKLLVTTKLLNALADHPEDVAELTNIMVERPGETFGENGENALDKMYQELKEAITTLTESSGKATSQSEANGIPVIIGDVPRLINAQDSAEGTTPEKKKKKRRSPSPASPSPPSPSGSPPSPSSSPPSPSR